MRYVDPELFRQVIGRLATGVAVVTTLSEGQSFGATVSALSSLSLEPPMLLVCLNRSSVTRSGVERAGRFAVNILAQHQQELALRFATKGTAKLDPHVSDLSRTGLPVIREAVGYLECVVVETARGGTHTVFMAAVVEASGTDGHPLVYYRGGFGRFLLFSRPPGGSVGR